MTEATPIFRKESLLYEREEKQGHWTFISKKHPETRELIVNPTGKEILNLCDGIRAMADIESEMKNRHPGVDEKRIKIDVAKTIASFSRLGIVEWHGDNPFLYKKEEPITDNISLMIGQEHDLEKIRVFIESVMGYQASISNNQNYLWYKSPLTSSSEYEEVALRQKLFAYVEEFFLLLRCGEIQGIIALEIPMMANSTAATVKLIVSPQEYFSKLLKYAQDNFPFLSVKAITKIRLFELLKAPLASEMKEALASEEYREEGILNDEFGFGGDTIILARTYERKFIEKIKAIKGGDINV